MLKRIYIFGNEGRYDVVVQHDITDDDIKGYREDGLGILDEFPEIGYNLYTVLDNLINIPRVLCRIDAVVQARF